MRRRILFFKLLTFISLVFTLTSCHKDYVNQNSDLSLSMSERVSSWLESKRLGDTKSSQNGNVMSVNSTEKKDKYANRNANVDLLKVNLDYLSAIKVSHSKKVDLLLIPINDKVRSQKNLAEIATLTLVLTLNKSGKILDGNIISFYPKDGKKHPLSPMVIANIFNDKPANDSGTLKFMSVTGQLLRQVVYAKNQIVSTGEIHAKAKDANVSTNSVCIDWYVTTTVYVGGVQVYQGEEYVGTTCDGCDTGMYESLCPSGDGGGGETSVIHETNFVADSEAEAADAMEDESGSPSPDGATSRYYPPVPYSHYAEIDYSTESGYTYVDDVRISPTTLTQNPLPFVDSYGYSGVRNVILYNHTNSKFYLIPPLVRITWKCDVYGIYTTTDSRSWTYYWVHTHVKTV